MNIQYKCGTKKKNGKKKRVCKVKPFNGKLTKGFKPGRI